jgi:hypothetical protein
VDYPRSSKTYEVQLLAVSRFDRAYPHPLFVFVMMIVSASVSVGGREHRQLIDLWESAGGHRARGLSAVQRGRVSR